MNQTDQPDVPPPARPHAMPDASHEAFGSRVKRAIFWRSGSQIVSQIVMWGSTLAVIRILDPSDYGLFAMSQTLMVFLAFLNGYGFASSLIQSENVEPKRIRQAFGMLLVMNVGLALLQIAVAPTVAAYYGQPVVADMLRVQAIIYLATPFMVVPEVMMSRALDFRRQAYVNLVAALAGAATALGCALTGFGVWTLVYAPIALFWTRAIGLSWAARLFVLPSFDFRGTSQMFGFGSALLVSHVFWTVQVQSDIFIAGRFLDPHALGLYAEALFIAQLFSSKFVPPLNEVAFPAYSRLQNDRAAMRWSFLKAVRLILLISCPVYFGLMVTAGPFVETLFGEKWLGMVPFVQLIALAMPFMTLQILFAPATNALGKPQITMQCSIFGAAIMPVAFLLAVSNFGSIGLAWVWLLIYPVLTTFTYLRSRALLGIDAAGLLQAVWPGVSASVAMAAIVYLMDSFLVAPALAGGGLFWLRLAILVAIGATAYGILLRVLAPETLAEILRLVIRKKPPTPVEAVDTPS